jgi:hypothetical protein
MPEKEKAPQQKVSFLSFKKCLFKKLITNSQTKIRTPDETMPRPSYTCTQSCTAVSQTQMVPNEKNGNGLTEKERTHPEFQPIL